MLTERQGALLRVIVHHMEKSGGVAPSFVQMSEALGLRSKSGLHRLLTSLEERGFIRRLPGRARALEIVRPLPIALAPGGDVGGDRDEASLDDLRALVDRLCRRNGKHATCATLVRLAQECLSQEHLSPCVPADAGAAR